MGDGPWRAILSQEGEKKRMWTEAEVEARLEKGYAKWAAPELQWCPRYYWDGRRYGTWDGNPSGTVWRRIPRQSLKDGVRVLLRFKSSRSEELEKAGRVSYNDKWAPAEVQNNLRRVAGTGDFRIGLMQTNAGGMGSWHAYQVRINPYLHREAKKHLGKDDTSNSSHWYRAAPAAGDLLMDDFSQEFHRFTKLKHKGELKFGMGPHAPYDEWVEIEVRLKATKDMISPAVRVHNDEVRLDPYKHATKGFKEDFEYVDAVCFSFNNMRPYCDVRLVAIE